MRGTARSLAAALTLRSTVVRGLAYESQLHRIAAREPEVKAFTEPAGDIVARVERCDAGLLVAVKDNIACDGLPPARCGSELPPEVAVKNNIACDGLPPASCGSDLPPGAHAINAGPEATVVTRLREAGCVIAGKTRLAEFAALAPPATTNPHTPACSPGGSFEGDARSREKNFWEKDPEQENGLVDPRKWKNDPYKYWTCKPRAEALVAFEAWDILNKPEPEEPPITPCVNDPEGTRKNKKGELVGDHFCDKRVKKCMTHPWLANLCPKTCKLCTAPQGPVVHVPPAVCKDAPMKRNNKGQMVPKKNSKMFCARKAGKHAALLGEVEFCMYWVMPLHSDNGCSHIHTVERRESAA